MVAKLFVINLDRKPYVNHIDGNKANARADNLEWCTPKENSEHAHRMNRYGIGSKNKNSILTEEAVSLIKDMINFGISNSNIAVCFNVDPSLISLIKTNKSWKNVI